MSEPLSTTADVLSVIKWPVYMLLRLVGFSPKPMIRGEMMMYGATAENPWLSVGVRADISRRRWFGDIESVKACRVRIRVRHANSGETRALGGGWIGNDARSFLTERTLSEGGLYIIPVVYVTDGLFMGKFLHLAHAMSDGEHWLTVELLAGARQIESFGMLFSVSTVAQMVAVEPMLTRVPNVSEVTRTVGHFNDGAVHHARIQ
jgi:hypothetical protein